MTVDYIIVGQGLAGSTLALALRARGSSVLLVDRGDLWSASRVAAGLMTTLAGKAMNPGVQQDVALFHALRWYQKLEKVWGCSMYHSVPILRLYDDLKQRDKLERKQDEVSDWLETLDAEVDAKQWLGQDGAFLMKHTGWLDTKMYLKFVKKELEECGSYRESNFREEDVALEEEGVEWQGVKAKHLILCQGAFGLVGQGQSWFGYVPHRSAKGDILTINAPGLDQNQIVSRNGWMVPLGGGVWKCGATYQWEALNSDLLKSGFNEVQRRISSLTSAEYTVRNHEVGVRPIIRKSQPVVGFHPQHRQVAFFNGLGSKGVMYAPILAEHLADVLIDGGEIDPMWDLSRLPGLRS